MGVSFEESLGGVMGKGKRSREVGLIVCIILISSINIK